MEKNKEVGVAPATPPQAEPISEPDTPMATAVGGAVVPYTDVPKAIYDEAQEDHRRYLFRELILEARLPSQVEHAEAAPPPVPPAIAEQTRLEMETGRKRNEHYAGIEAQRLKMVEAQKKDQWADKPTEQVFRPANYIPDPRKTPGQRSLTVPL